MISMLPRFNCYLFFLLRSVAIKCDIVQKTDKQEKLMKQTNCFKILLFNLYMTISRFYGINYYEENEYQSKSKDIDQDIKKMFYVNHEDDFTAQQLDQHQCSISSQLFYHEMEKKSHSQIRINFFRTFFENIPQLFLQYKMIQILQNSNVKGCKQTDSAFYVSISVTLLNMVIGLINILKVVFNKILDGDLVIADISKQFDKYLSELKVHQTDNVFKIEDSIEFWPKMIEPLYQFLSENQKYKQMVFGEHVQFKGDFKMYAKQIDLVEQQQQIRDGIKIVFENQGNKRQIFAELTLKKIFEDLLIKQAISEYVQKKVRRKICCLGWNAMTPQFRIKSGFRFTGDIKQWKILMEQGLIEIDQEMELEYSDRSVESLLFANSVFGLMNRQLTIYVDHSTFSIHLLIMLSKMKTIILQLNFRCKHQRVQEFIDQYKVIISRMSQPLDWEQQYEQLLGLEHELEGIKVELQTNQQLFALDMNESNIIEQQNRFRNVVDFRQMKIIIAADYQSSVQQARHLIKNNMKEGVRQIVLDNFRLNQSYDYELLDLVVQMVHKHPHVKLQYQTQLLQEEEQQSVDKQTMKQVMLNNGLSFSQISIGKYPQQAQTVDQIFDSHLELEYQQQLFGKVEVMEYIVNNYNYDRIEQLIKRRKDGTSKYKVNEIVISLKHKIKISTMTNIIKFICSYHPDTHNLVLNYQLDDKEYQFNLMHLVNDLIKSNEIGSLSVQQINSNSQEDLFFQPVL